MATTAYIVDVVEQLARKYGTRNPYELCDALGIKIHYKDLKKKLKGFFFYQSRQKNIVIDYNVNKIKEVSMNNQMTEQERQFYFVQHKFLPHLFYSGSKPFVKRILTLGGDSFVDLLCAMNDDEESDEEYTCPYIASDFAVKDVYKGEDFTITQVLMPDASISPLCRCIYFAYSPDWKERFVYTVERSPEDTYLLCGWGEDESHMIFEMPTPDDPTDEVQKVAELFKSIDDYKNLGEKLKAQMAQ